MRWGIGIVLGALLLAAPVSVLAEDWEIREVTHTFTARAGTEGFAKDGEAIALPEGAAIYQKDGAMMLPAEPFLKSLGDDISLEWDKFNEGVLYAFWGDARLTFDVKKKKVEAGRLGDIKAEGMELRGNQLFLPLRDWAEILPGFYCKAQGITWDAKTQTAALEIAAEEMEAETEAPIPTGTGAMPEYILQPTREYESIRNLGDGYFSASTGAPERKTFILDSTGKAIQSYGAKFGVEYVGEGLFQITERGSRRDGGYVVDKSGKKIFQTGRKDDLWFSEGLSLTEGEKGTGFLDTRGEVVIPAKYHNARPFSEGLAAVAILDKSIAGDDWHMGRRWGYIDKEGTLVIDTKYTSCGSFHEGLAYVCREDGKFGYVDKTGREIIPPQFDCAGDFQNGKALVTEGENTKDGKLWAIDRTGKKLKLVAETAAVYEPSGWSGVAATTHTAMFRGKPVSFATYYNADGKIPYAERLWLQNASDGLMAFQDEKMGKWGYVNHDWRWAIAPVLDHAGDFQDGYAVVYQETKQGDVTIDSAWGIIKKP